MAFRGRGRGRGGFGGGRFGGRRFGVNAIQEPFVLFPEDVTLPNINSVKEEEIMLMKWNRELQIYWKASPYYLEVPEEKKNNDIDIERYSDRHKPKGQTKRDSLASHLKLAPNNFPTELIEGSKQRNQGKVQWNPERGEEAAWEKFQKDLEEKGGEDEKKNKNEDEDDDENEEEISEEESASDDDGDYNQNKDFDDDEDPFNEGDDEEDLTYDNDVDY